MSPILVIGVVFLVLLACGVAFDLRRRGWMAAAATSAWRHGTPAAPPGPAAGGGRSPGRYGAGSRPLSSTPGMMGAAERNREVPDRTAQFRG